MSCLINTITRDSCKQFANGGIKTLHLYNHELFTSISPAIATDSGMTITSGSTDGGLIFKDFQFEKDMCNFTFDVNKDTGMVALTIIAKFKSYDNTKANTIKLMTQSLVGAIVEFRNGDLYCFGEEYGLDSGWSYDSGLKIGDPAYLTLTLTGEERFTPRKCYATILAVTP